MRSRQSFPWIEVQDGNPYALALYLNHYSARESRPKTGRASTLFVGPGRKMVLLSIRLDALLVWRDCINDAGETGIYCSVFRNESYWQSSWLLRVAMWLAWSKWGPQRLYTYVNPHRIKSTNPGYCFRAAGWHPCGITKKKKLTVFEFLPSWANQNDPAVAFTHQHPHRPLTTQDIDAAGGATLRIKTRVCFPDG